MKQQINTNNPPMIDRDRNITHKYTPRGCYLSLRFHIYNSTALNLLSLTIFFFFFYFIRTNGTRIKREDKCSSVLTIERHEKKKKKTKIVSLAR